MANTISVDQQANREERYRQLLPQLEALLAGENNLIANLANTAAAIKEAMGFFWVGFYLPAGDQLVLGPFQGSVACTRLPLGKGVCSRAYLDKKTVIVPDVDAFPGHIACNSAARSEIVVPGLNQQGEVLFVLDIDSDKPDDFTSTDATYLEKMVALLAAAI